MKWNSVDFSAKAHPHAVVHLASGMDQEAFVTRCIGLSVVPFPLVTTHKVLGGVTMSAQGSPSRSP